MAKKAASGEGKDVNKSQAIREYLAANKDAKPIDVSKALTAQGVDVSPAFVSQIKLKLKQAAGAPKKRPGRQKKSETTAATSPAPSKSNGDSFQMADLLEAKRLVDKLGASKARAAVDLLTKLS